MKLKAGDIRQEGDECRHKDLSPFGFDCTGSMISFWDRYKNKRVEHEPVPRAARPGAWEPVKLIGWPILESDLMTMEYRRG